MARVRPAVAALLLLLLALLHLAAAKPYKQRDCLDDCQLCAACAQNPITHSTGCIAQCLLCDMCHACLHNKECQWEVRPVPDPPQDHQQNDRVGDS